jgi:hypothetical protein
MHQEKMLAAATVWVNDYPIPPARRTCAELPAHETEFARIGLAALEWHLARNSNAWRDIPDRYAKAIMRRAPATPRVLDLLVQWAVP